MIDFSQVKPTLKRQFVFEGSWPTAVAFVNNGQRVAAGNQLGQILVWDLAESPVLGEGTILTAKDAPAPNHAPCRALVGHENGVTRLVSSPDGRWLFSASLDHTVRVWEMTAPATGATEIVLDPELRRAEARRTADEKINSAPGVKLETQGPAHTLAGHDDWVSALALSADGRLLVSGDYGSRIIVWDVAERREIARWSGWPWNWIFALAIAPDNRSVLVSEFRYKRDDFDMPAAAARVWNLDSREPSLDILRAQVPSYDPSQSSYELAQPWKRIVKEGFIAVDFSPDGKLLALAQAGETDTGKVLLVDALTGGLVAEVSGHQYGATDMRFSRDGRFVLSAGRDTCLRICQVEDGKEVQQLGAPRGGQFKDWFSAMAVSPDETRLAASDIAGLVHVWMPS